MGERRGNTRGKKERERGRGTGTERRRMNRSGGGGEGKWRRETERDGNSRTNVLLLRDHSDIKEQHRATQSTVCHCSIPFIEEAVE